MDKKIKGLPSIRNDEEDLKYVITILLHHNGIQDHLEIANSNLLSLGMDGKELNLHLITKKGKMYEQNNKTIPL